MKQQFLVIGAGRFGTAVATTLYELGHEVAVVDHRQNSIEAIMNDVSHAMIADATDEDALIKVGVANFDTVIVAIGTDLEANILATTAAKSAGAKHVISKATSDLGARVLTRIGADQVVRPEHDMGKRLAEQLAAPNVIDSLKLGELHGVLELEAGSKLVGRLDELRLPNRFGVQLVAVHRDDEVVVAPDAEYVLRRGDRLVLIGTNEDLDRLREKIARAD